MAGIGRGEPCMNMQGKDPRVTAAVTEWPPHTRAWRDTQPRIIRNVLAVDETYAVCLKRGQQGPSGSIRRDQESQQPQLPDTGEMGYWLGVPISGAGDCT